MGTSGAIPLRSKQVWLQKRIKEEDYIREQGSEPLKSNLIRRLVKTYWEYIAHRARSQPVTQEIRTRSDMARP